MENAKKVIKESRKNFQEMSAEKNTDLLRSIARMMPEHIIVAMSSACGILRGAVDELRSQGKESRIVEDNTVQAIP